MLPGTKAVKQPPKGAESGSQRTRNAYGLNVSALPPVAVAVIVITKRLPFAVFGSLNVQAPRPVPRSRFPASVARQVNAVATAVSAVSNTSWMLLTLNVDPARGAKAENLGLIASMCGGVRV
jgi:hypothetical protein